MSAVLLSAILIGYTYLVRNLSLSRREKWSAIFGFSRYNQRKTNRMIVRPCGPHNGHPGPALCPSGRTERLPSKNGRNSHALVRLPVPSVSAEAPEACLTWACPRKSPHVLSPPSAVCRAEPGLVVYSLVARASHCCPSPGSSAILPARAKTASRTRGDIDSLSLCHCR